MGEVRCQVWNVFFNLRRRWPGQLPYSTTPGDLHQEGHMLTHYWDLAVRQSYGRRLLIDKRFRTTVSCSHMANEGSLPVGRLTTAVNVGPQVQVLGHVAQVIFVSSGM